MKISSLARYGLGLAAGLAFLAGCSAAGTSPSLGSGSSMVPPAGRSEASKMFAMTNVMHQGLGTVKGTIRHSWMKHVPAGTLLLYASDDSYLTVDVYDYPSGTLVGQATGFGDPFGLCSDKKGNVYVADYTSGNAYEIGAGTTTIINSWSVGGSPIGCDVSAKGDLAVSDFYGSTGPSGSGSVTIFKGGGATGTNYPGPAYDWAPGYDKKGNLFVECNYVSPCTSPSVYELPAGGSSFTPITVSGATIDFAAAVEDEGKKGIGLGDQEPNGQFALGIHTGKLSGSTFTVTNSAVDTGTCNGAYMDAESWANLSKKPNGLQVKKTPKDDVAANLFCSTYPISEFAFPAGGSPVSTFNAYNSAYTIGQTLIVH